MTLKRRLVVDQLVKGLLWILASLLLIPLGGIIGYVFFRGIPAINWAFLTETPRPVGESGGGILNALIGTIMLVINASFVAIPLGVFTGIFLTEYPSTWWSGIVRFCIETLQGIPSIVLGIVLYVWLVVPFGHFSSFSGSIALAIMMIPIIARSTEETLKRIPHSLKEASLALGVSYPTTLFRVILPAGSNGIVTGILLSIARVSGETAPLLFTAFGNPFVSFNPAKPVESIPLLIFNYSTSPYESWQRIGWGASCLLITLTFFLTFTTKWITKKRF